MAVGAACQEKRQYVRIGLVESMFRDIDERTVKASIDQFRDIMERETGHTGESVTIKDYSGVADQLVKDKIQLGAVHGFEFAWLRQKYPDLRALVVAVNQQVYTRSLILTRAGVSVRDFASLKGQSIAVPERTTASCQLFLERICLKSGAETNRYFAKTTKPVSVEDALDDLVDGVVEAALVDSVGFGGYQGRKPARAARLREVERSPPFPPTAVLYRPGVLEEETLARFRKALVELNRRADGREVLTTWKLTAYKLVPADYGRHLEEIAAAYPQSSGR
jgi:ABC-type phosphate/phosphonate transport system substrate-binding protein